MRDDESLSELPARAGLVALDLDGTVLDPSGHVTARTRDAIRSVLDAGVAVCIATGRSWWESRAVIREAGLIGPGVFVGGAVVNDMASGQSLDHTRMAPSVAREICQIMEDFGIAAMTMQDASHAEVEWLISAELEMPRTVPRLTDGSRVCVKRCTTGRSASARSAPKSRASD
jgi:hydroxymethylpyrimidine pyrophosphatase-like HAD family hydrolase